MVKHFCEQCGDQTKYRGHPFPTLGVALLNKKEPTRTGFHVSFAISWSSHDFDLCDSCRDSIIDEAYQELVKRRNQKEPVVFTL